MTLARARELLGRGKALPGDSARAAMMPGYRRAAEASTATGKTAVKPWRDAAVMVLLFPDPVSGEARFPLILRPEGGGTHAGQISLPGGAREGGEPYEDCARRELFEELGVEPAGVRIVASLSVLKIEPSRFVVRPFVGIVDSKPTFLPEASEVVDIYEPALDELLDPASRLEYELEADGKLWRIPYFSLCGQRVWGATAMMLAELAAMLED